MRNDDGTAFWAGVFLCCLIAALIIQTIDYVWFPCECERREHIAKIVVSESAGSKAIHLRRPRDER